MELVELGLGEDVVLAAELEISETVPVYEQRVYKVMEPPGTRALTTEARQ